MSVVINLDDATEVNVIAHENEICSITFTLSDGDVWSVNAAIKVGVSYDHIAQKTYTVGDGLTITDQVLLWRFNPADWGNRSMVYDASVIRIANQQRDWHGRITINKSF